MNRGSETVRGCTAPSTRQAPKPWKQLLPSQIRPGGLSTCRWEQVRRHTPPWSRSPHVFQGRGIQGPTEFLSSHALLSNPSRAPVDSGAYHGLPSLLSKFSLLLHLSKYQLVIVSPSHMGLWIKILIHTCTH